jgi:hypothetical protein
MVIVSTGSAATPFNRLATFIMHSTGSLAATPHSTAATRQQAPQARIQQTRSNARIQQARSNAVSWAQRHAVQQARGEKENAHSTGSQQRSTVQRATATPFQQAHPAPPQAA